MTTILSQMMSVMMNKHIEGMQDPRLERINRLAKIDKFEREKLKADIEFSRKPEWVQAIEEGDRLSDGSDEQPYEQEED